MARIPFVTGNFVDPKFTKSGIEQRLRKHFVQMKALKATSDQGGGPVDLDDDGNAKQLPWAARQKINRRADKIVACANRRSVLGNLKPDDRQRLEFLRDGLNVVAIPSMHRADEIGAALHDMFPWMEMATKTVWHGLRRSVEQGDPGVRVPPLLLDGPPGIGKSYFARELAKHLGMPSMVVEASNENASFGIVGSQKGWGNAAPGRLINFMLSEKVGNVMVILDEVEKAGDVRSNKGMAFSLTEALLPLLEPLSAARWSCPYHQIPFDMSWLGWVMTTNNYRLLPDPLLSRCPPIRLPAPTVEQLKSFARRQAVARKLSTPSIEAICDALDRVGAGGQLPDLRTVIRTLDRAEQLERRPPLH